ncbi:MAG: LysR family transcriptional regulator [Cypionkella sp.]
MQNPLQLDWNDLRHFLAVARHGSTLAASRALRVSQSTVSRRIDLAEQTLNLRLFDRMRTGYALTEAGRKLVPFAETVEAACGAFEREAIAWARGLSGKVRLTTNEMTANAYLDRALAQMQDAYPTLQIETVTDERLVDLANGEADIAIRGGRRPHEAGLFGRMLTLDPWSVYASPDYVARNGKPASMAETGSHRFVSLLPGRVERHIVDMIEGFLSTREIAVRRDTMTGMLAAIRSGVGLGVMSDFVAVADPGVTRCFGVEQSETPEIWLLTHERLRHEPRIRVVMDFLAGYFSTARSNLKQESGQPVAAVRSGAAK